jgi:surface polysaccharide O-acyltransferase-like enzyme
MGVDRRPRPPGDQVVAVLARAGCGSRVYHLWYVYVQLALYLAIPLLRPLAAQATPTLCWYSSASGCYGIYLFHPLLLDVLGSGVLGVRITSASLPPFVEIPALAAGRFSCRSA